MSFPSSNNHWIEALLALRSRTLHVVHEADGIVASVTRSSTDAEGQSSFGDRARSLNEAVGDVHYQAQTLLERLGNSVDQAGNGADRSPKRSFLGLSRSSETANDHDLDADLHALSRLIDLLDEHRDAIAHRLSLIEAQSEAAVRTAADMRATSSAANDAGRTVDAMSDMIGNAEAAIGVLLHDLRIVDAMAALARLHTERGVVVHAASGHADIEEPEGYLGQVVDLRRLQLLSASDIESRRRKAGDLLSTLTAERPAEIRREDAPSS